VRKSGSGKMEHQEFSVPKVAHILQHYQPFGANGEGTSTAVHELLGVHSEDDLRNEFQGRVDSRHVGNDFFQNRVRGPENLLFDAGRLANRHFESVGRSRMVLRWIVVF